MQPESKGGITTISMHDRDSIYFETDITDFPYQSMRKWKLHK